MSSQKPVCLPSPRNAIAVHLELLTPAFLGGARPRQADPYLPLRPSSVRGLLRYWFRAAAAPFLPTARPGDPTAPLELLKKIESEVFGATDCASRVIAFPPRGGHIEELACPDRRTQRGLCYLGYGLFENSARSPRVLVAPADDPLVLHLDVARRGMDGLADVLAATLWLWTNLGGLGARSRRGFGSARLLETSGLPSAWRERLAPPRTRDDLLQSLDTGIAAARRTFGDFLNRHWSGKVLREPGPTSAPLDLRTLAGITSLALPPHDLPRDFPSGLAALETAGRLFQDFRSTLERRSLGLPPLPDYFEVKRSLSQGSPARSVVRTAFGLPLPFYFRSLGGQKTNFLPRDADRLGSPLLFRVHRLAGASRFATVLVNLAQAPGASPLLRRTVVQGRKDGPPVGPPDATILEQFVEWARRELAALPGGGTEGPSHA